MKPPLFRSKNSALPNLAAFLYLFAAYGAGLWLITAPSLAANLLGTLLLAHALVIAAYFLHDFIHGSIFSSRDHNAMAGRLMAWLTGAAFASYAGLREKHLRHHADRLDVVTFSYRKFLTGKPAWVTRLILALEWAYIPAVEFLMHGFVVAAQFREAKTARRRRVLLVLASRVLFFAVLAWCAWKALLFYGLAYIIFLHVLRFMDAFQHTYEVFEVTAFAIPPASLRDHAYEQANTYSNVLSVSYPVLDLLTLNFAYHNAHHARPNVPWHELPALHTGLYGLDRTQVLPARTLFGTWHRNRLRRVTDQDYGRVNDAGDRTGGFVGAVGVSFLTAI
jgi:fatty acid desaturase